VTAAVVIAIFIVGIFAVDVGLRWWRENEWRRRWRNKDED